VSEPVVVFLVLDVDGRELLSTPAPEIATWALNRIDGALRVVTDGGVLIATRCYLPAESVSAWLTRLGYQVPS
jgi:hypothetical protein